MLFVAIQILKIGLLQNLQNSISDKKFFFGYFGFGEEPFHQYISKLMAEQNTQNPKIPERKTPEIEISILKKVVNSVFMLKASGR